MRTIDNPRSDQKNSFFGIGGVETIDGGQRGRFTDVSGLLAGADLSGLAVSQETFRSFDDGRSRILIDTRGVTWLYVKLVNFEPAAGKIHRDGDGFCYQEYQAKFFHLY